MNMQTTTRVQIDYAFPGQDVGDAAENPASLLENLETSHDARADSAVMLRLAACRSLRGARETNQDIAVALELDVQHFERVTLLAQADGMGGQPAGEVASREAVRALHCSFEKNLLEAAQGQGRGDVADWLRSGFQAANRWLLTYAGSHPDCAGMGTTLCAAVAAEGRLYTAGIGDSRLYLYRGGCAHQLTTDDSYPWLLVDQGILTPEEAETHPTGHMLTRYIGDPNGLDDVFVGVHALAPGDLVLAVTDGVWKDGGEELAWFAEILARASFGQASLDAAVSCLLERALARGATDNVSAAAFWVAPDGRDAARAPQPANETLAPEED